MDIMVNVLMPVYNHERYLAKAIEGILRQRTNFRYELTIVEDYSTDRSREIVLEYQKRYPGIIRALLNPVNLGMYKNGWQVVKAARGRGRYIANCEGDDYWTDPEKLQIQVDFLESHPEYSGCYHSVNVVDEYDNPRDIGPTPYIIQEDEDYDKASWKKCILPGQSGSIVMRNYYTNMKKKDFQMYMSAMCNGDNKIPILLLCYGKIRKMARVMSCYRRSYTGDSWNARCSREDMRAYWYINSMEREKLVMRWWGIKYMPHNEARGHLLNILGDVVAGKEAGIKLLQKMATYNPWQLVAFLLAYDLNRMYEWEKPLMSDFGINNNSDSTWVIFGTGVYGEKCYEMLESLGVSDKIIMFWDNNEKKQGDRLHGIPVEKPSAGINKDCKILISSRKYGTVMREQLRELGYLDEQIFSVKEQIKMSINKLFLVGRSVL